MVNIAIAGGTGNIGGTIAEVLRGNPKHRIIVLSRKAGANQDDAAPVVVVDYDDIDGLAEILKKHNVHTVISAIQVTNLESGVSEVNLVRASDKASTPKRFITSDWGVDWPEKDKWSVEHVARAASIEELRKTNLEWTTFRVGYFLDYFGIPYIKSRFMPMAIQLDVVNKAAAIPGTGNDLVSFTYSFDVAKFVEAALDLPQWEEVSYCVGDTCTLNDVVRIAEEARGEKFDVTYDGIEKLEKGEVTELPGQSSAYTYFPKEVLQRIFANFGLRITQGLFRIPEEKALNKKFPEIRTMTVKEVLDSWKGK